VGLDCFLRKVSKKKIHAICGELLSPAPRLGEAVRRLDGLYTFKNEVGYWRSWTTLNYYVTTLGVERLGDVPDPTEARYLLNGQPILLTHDDIMAIKLEVIWGDLWAPRENLARIDAEYLKKDPEAHIAEVKAKDLEVFDRALRILKANRSYVYYCGSW
jgi:hypothetical protein